MTPLRLVVSLLASAQALATPPAANGAREKRTVAIISDVHFGLGRVAGKEWDKREDFRWPKALAAFLEELRRRGNDAVDLVIAGDLLDLWQGPASVKCTGPTPELGCTVGELEEVTRAVVAAHRDDLASIGRFASRGKNHVFIVPGNHDAALLADEVWAIVAAALSGDPGRVERVGSGVWTSSDGRIVVEHGHQIGIGSNAFATWPDVVKERGEKRYVERPWGELFVQALFNEVEGDYPIIDNLSPESAGIRYRIEDRGFFGAAKDIARFIAFNAFQTSARQLGAVLGPGKGPPGWDLDRARESGHRLVIAALAPDDPLRAKLQGSGQEAAAVRRELDALVKDLPPDRLRGMCELAAQASPDRPGLCRDPALGAYFQGKVVPLRWVLASHLRMRLGEDQRASVFVYGHTHEMQTALPVEVSSVLTVNVFNSGAFQRVVGEEGFRRRAADRKWSTAEALRELRPEDLAPCYGAIVIHYEDTIPSPRAFQWLMEEDAAKGELVPAGDARCE